MATITKGNEVTVKNNTTKGNEGTMKKNKTKPVTKPVKATKAKPEAVETKRGPGRPPVFTEQERAKLVTYMKKFGLSKGVEEASKGTLHKGRGVTMSVPTAFKIAKAAGIVFPKGRPCKVKAK